MDEEDREDAFTKAANHARGLTSLDQATMLTIYGLYKQATIGQCNVGKPAFWDLVGKSKWESWKKLGDMERSIAKLKYIDLVKELDPTWDASSPNETKPQRIQGQGVSVSKFCHQDEEIIKDDEKTVFDWCKEGNIAEVSRIASDNGFDVNAQDANGMSLLHWSCDQGHTEFVDFLIKLKANINQQDNELQTPLHYAAVCENEEIVKKLLLAGADHELKDDAGLTAYESTSSTLIRNLISSKCNKVS